MFLARILAGLSPKRLWHSMADKCCSEIETLEGWFEAEPEALEDRQVREHGQQLRKRRHAHVEGCDAARSRLMG